MSHGDEALELPPGFAAPRSQRTRWRHRNDERRIWAVQFHPEVHHTPLGRKSSGISSSTSAARRGDWTPAHFIETTVAVIRQKVGGHVICGLSGGVDSSVAAMLVHKAIGAS